MKLASDREFAIANGVDLGPFGTKHKRFTEGYFDPKEGPGPG